MTITTDFEPTWASPPGETIRDILESRSISQQTFKVALNLSDANVSALLSGDLKITTDFARGLSGYFGNSFEFWFNRETQYRNSLARLNSELAAWVKKLPTKEMETLGWIPGPDSQSSLIQRCLDFFGVPDLCSWVYRYEQVMGSTAFRASTAFEGKREAIVSWLRQGQIEGGRFATADWDQKRFADSLASIRSLTRIRDPKKFLPRLREICASSGVQVAVVRTFAGCPISGATLPVGDNKRLLILSFRYLTDDQFWFTFFHEAGHLVLHDTSRAILEFKNEESKPEDEANEFAMNTLVGLETRKRLLEVSITPKSIVALAATLGISPGILVGQLQFLGRIEKSKMNFLKSRFQWE